MFGFVSKISFAIIIKLLIQNVGLITCSFKFSSIFVKISSLG